MAIDLDAPPVYDKVVNNDMHFSGVMQGWLSTFVQSLTEYLSQNGIFLPALTTTQRNAIQTPVNGQTIYNTSLNAPQIYQGGAWKTFTTT